jgi:hypothetical protein
MFHIVAHCCTSLQHIARSTCRPRLRPETARVSAHDCRFHSSGTEGAGQLRAWVTPHLANCRNEYAWTMGVLVLGASRFQHISTTACRQLRRF